MRACVGADGRVYLCMSYVCASGCILCECVFVRKERVKMSEREGTSAMESICVCVRVCLTGYACKLASGRHE